LSNGITPLSASIVISKGMKNMTESLQTRGLSRSYGKFQALAPTNLNLNPGEIAALVGLNGAGKTTLLLCLSGLLRPSSGTITIDGHDLYIEEKEAKRQLAFVPDVPHFYAELTAWEHLYFIAQAHQAGEGFDQKAETLLREFGLWEARNLFPHNYSRGMRLKLGLLVALIRPFKVLLLDEPTSALDVESVDFLSNRLKDLRHDGASILLSSHDPNIAKNLADRTLKIQEGHLNEL
jgi:ABC-2 type transport system ATP-binding protein